MANTISTSGIQSGSVIRAENLIRIIDALSGISYNGILISGSVGITGSFGIEGLSEVGPGDSPQLLAYNTASGVVSFSNRESTNGTSGTSGTSGTTGTDGSSGTSGTSGTDGTSGNSGSSGTSGTNGTNGSSGSSGTSGTSGTSGEKGGVEYGFDDTITDADPGNGNLRYNNATISSVSFIYIDNLDQRSVDQTAWYSTWDTSNNPTDRGTLIISSRDDSTIVNLFTITGDVTSATGYYKIPVSYVSGDLPTDLDKLVIQFTATGNNGTSGTSGLTVVNDGENKFLLATGLGATFSGSNNLIYNTPNNQVIASGSIIISGSLIVTGSDGVNINSFISSSFLGDGSGLTGIPSASVAARATTLSNLATASFSDLASDSRTSNSSSVAARATELSADATASFSDSSTTASFADLASDSRTSTSSSVAAIATLLSPEATASISDFATSASHALTIKNGLTSEFVGLTVTSDLDVYGAVSASSTGEFSGLGIGTAPSGTVGSILATNDIVAFASSDERLKENILVIPNAVEKIQQMNGVSFDWIPMEEIHVHSGHDIGIIAQDIEKVFPEVVTTRKNGYKAVKYEKLISVLIEGIKELKSEIDDLRYQINK